MDIFLQLLLFVLGFVLLIKGASFLVDGSSGIARRMKVSETMIGMTVVAFGTSMPELFIAIQSFASGNTDLTLGDIIGCVISNILLILGIAAVIRPIKIRKGTIKKEIPFYFFVIGSFVALTLSARLRGAPMGRIDGGILVLLFVAFLGLIFWLARRRKGSEAEQARKNKKAEAKLWVYILMTLGGIVSVIVGSYLVVDLAAKIAAEFGISERMIAITIVAMGTSLPELITAITAAKKNKQELLIGDAIGGNIFNICVVLGLPILVYGSLDVANFEIFDLVMVLIAALMLFITTRKEHIITRSEGVLMLTIFAIYYATIII